ncbi:hypothetical protein GSI_09794 [Ganoderma sinense ZZ0214-1]|uniref:Uncharacterized protein n=1 Tax=Ganoderma sinense ZZ0214-1 TaxID=1077348 RepID=A0A2G8S2Y3_9APHY|nr:hypothetical protein GSI_09794 [Ganoderma sinense ZZ0214-1]
MKSTTSKHLQDRRRSGPAGVDCIGDFATAERGYLLVFSHVIVRNNRSLSALLHSLRMHCARSIGFGGPLSTPLAEVTHDEVLEIFDRALGRDTSGDGPRPFDPPCLRRTTGIGSAPDAEGGTCEGSGLKTWKRKRDSVTTRTRP